MLLRAHWEKQIWTRPTTRWKPHWCIHSHECRDSPVPTVSIPDTTELFPIEKCSPSRWYTKPWPCVVWSHHSHPNQSWKGGPIFSFQYYCVTSHVSKYLGSTCEKKNTREIRLDMYDFARPTRSYNVDHQRCGPVHIIKEFMNLWSLLDDGKLWQCLYELPISWFLIWLREWKKKKKHLGKFKNPIFTCFKIFN